MSLWLGTKCLVTGATGFVGSNLIPALVDKGASVAAVSRHPEKLHSMPKTVNIMAADLTEAGAADAVIARFQPDLIFHLAGYVSGVNAADLIVPMFEANTAATVYLLNAAINRVRRVVTVGSIEEYAIGSTALTPYSIAKQAASLYSDYFRAAHLLPVTPVVLHFAYGPHQPISKFIPYVITSYLRGRQPRLGMPERECDFVYIRDVVAALLSAAECQSNADAPLEIGSGERISLLQVAEEIKDIMNPDAAKPIAGIPDQRPPNPRGLSDPAVMHNWGWRPATSRERGLRETIDWYRNNTSQSSKLL